MDGVILILVVVGLMVFHKYGLAALFALIALRGRPHKFRRLWGFVKHPGRVWHLLNAPPQLSASELAGQWFPGVGVRDLLVEYDHLPERVWANDKMRAVRHRDIEWRLWDKALYVMVRLIKPNIMIETGTYDGQATVVILAAMDRNGRGKLYSIDTPDVKDRAIEGATSEMPEGMMPKGHNPGWLVGEHPRAVFILEPAETALPRLCSRFSGLIDIFLHDSLHTFGHQMFEYKTVWPHLADGGYLFSDDVVWSSAYRRFCAKHGALWQWSGGMGVARKIVGCCHHKAA